MVLGRRIFLLFTKALALSERFAVVHVGQDTGLATLGNPQRHMTALLESLTVPSYGRLLEWLATSLDEPNQAETLARHIRQLRRNRPEVSGIAEDILVRMRYPISGLRATKVMEFASASHLAKKTNYPGARAEAYRILEFWAAFCVEVLGCKGIFILLDELENLFSNSIYVNYISRYAGYRTLSYYSTGIENAVVIFGLTPEGWHRVQEEIKLARDHLLQQRSRRPEEDINVFCSRILSNEGYRLSRMNENDYRYLAKQAGRIHARARGYTTIFSPRAEFNSGAFTPSMTPRLFLRGVISSLEAKWFDSHYGKIETVEQL